MKQKKSYATSGKAKGVRTRAITTKKANVWNWMLKHIRLGWKRIYIKWDW